MNNKYLKYKLKYLNLKMQIGGTVEICNSISGENLTLTNINREDNITKLFDEIDKKVDKEYNLIVSKTGEILKRDDKRCIKDITTDIKDITTGIEYVILQPRINFQDIDEFILYINGISLIKDYSIYCYIMHNLLYNLEEEQEELSDYTKLNEFLDGKALEIIKKIRFTNMMYYDAGEDSEDDEIMEKIYKISEITNKDFIIFCIKNFGWFPIELINSELKKDQEFILNCVVYYPDILKYIDTNLKEDINFILKAIGKNYKSFKYISADLKNYKKFVCYVLKYDNRVLEYVSENFKQDFLNGVLCNES